MCIHIYTNINGSWVICSRVMSQGLFLERPGISYVDVTDDFSLMVLSRNVCVLDNKACHHFDMIPCAFYNRLCLSYSSPVA